MLNANFSIISAISDLYETDLWKRHITVQHKIDRVTVQHKIDRVTVQHKIDRVTVQHKIDRVTVQHKIESLYSKKLTITV